MDVYGAFAQYLSSLNTLPGLVGVVDFAGWVAGNAVDAIVAEHYGQNCQADQDYTEGWPVESEIGQYFPGVVFGFLASISQPAQHCQQINNNR